MTCSWPSTVARLPAPVDWVPLLVYVFDRRRIRHRVLPWFHPGAAQRESRPGPGIAIAAALNAAYHVGYGMSAEGMIFLFGLGEV